MFSVDGWSVPLRQLKLQTSLSAGSEQTAVPKIQDAGPNLKRKRASKKQDTAIVTPDNLVELWERHKGTTSLTYMHEKATDSDGISNRRRLIYPTKPQSGSDDKVTESRSTAAIKVEHITRISSREKTTEHKKRPKLQHPAASRGVKPLQKKDSAENMFNGDMEIMKTTDTSTPVYSRSTFALSDDTATLTPLQSKMRQKLISARFRHLNQLLYSTPSSSSLDLFRSNPSLFSEYHEGFQRQVDAWPENPVLTFISWILSRGVNLMGSKPESLKLGSQKSSFKKSLPHANKSPSNNASSLNDHTPGFHTGIEPLPRDRRSNICTIADLGCGSALLARTLAPKSRSLHIKVYSFDLYAPDPFITAADISKIPLPDSSIDVAISCLALMGTNWLDYVEEAYRLLRWKGEYWIAEVTSRFVSNSSTGEGDARSRRNKYNRGLRAEKPNGHRCVDDETKSDTRLLSDEEPSPTSGRTLEVDVQQNFKAFVAVLRTRGFQIAGEPEVGNKMFVRMKFVKCLIPVRGNETPREIQVHSQAFQRKKFLERGRDSKEPVSIEDEGKILKPCVYKIR